MIERFLDSQSREAQSGARPLDSGPAFSISELCAVFEVSRSGFYAHRHKDQRPRRREDELLKGEIKQAFDEGREAYGSPRVVQVLKARGLPCGKNRARRLMHEQGLVAKRKRRRQPRTTDSSHGLPVPPNLLGELPAPTAVNQQWVSDITYIPTKEGWLYLAGTLDRYSRRIVGWQTSAYAEANLVIAAAASAIGKRRPARGLIYHSDRGVQYISQACRKLLGDHDMVQSMSRKANCYDNAMMESFWATLKVECFGFEIPATRAQATSMIFDYIEIFYNRQRIHSALGYLSPVQYEMKTGPTA
jgi:transposase InsO family protein